MGNVAASGKGSGPHPYSALRRPWTDARRPALTVRASAGALPASPPGRNARSRWRNAIAHRGRDVRICREVPRLVELRLARQAAFQDAVHHVVVLGRAEMPSADPVRDIRIMREIPSLVDETDLQHRTSPCSRKYCRYTAADKQLQAARRTNDRLDSRHQDRGNLVRRGAEARIQASASCTTTKTGPGTESPEAEARRAANAARMRAGGRIAGTNSM